MNIAYSLVVHVRIYADVECNYKHTLVFQSNFPRKKSYTHVQISIDATTEFLTFSPVSRFSNVSRTASFSLSCVAKQVFQCLKLKGFAATTAIFRATTARVAQNKAPRKSQAQKNAAAAMPTTALKSRKAEDSTLRDPFLRKPAMAIAAQNFVRWTMLWCLGFLVLVHQSAAQSISTTEKKLYIVYMGSNNNQPSVEITTSNHHNLLMSVLGSTGTTQTSIVHSYNHGINGFSAMLTEAEAAQISIMPGVVSAFPSVSYSLQTTRTWDYMGVSLHGNGPWTSTKFGEDIIVATIDTGVWPEHKSFDDAFMGPIPSKWKGECEAGQSLPKFQCNKKLIGARYFSAGYEAMWGKLNTSDPSISVSPRDTEGHGTHTTTTLGGSRTNNVSFQGSLGNGTARGGAANSRLVSYKVCWPGSCTTADIISAFDMAIHDGVDVIAISLGASAVDYFYDSIAIGSFHATEKGILVVAAGGNAGPQKATVINGAPWVLTAAASSIDREYLSYIHLGNNVTYWGPSLDTGNIVAKPYPLVYSEDIPAHNITSADARVCSPGSLDAEKVKDSIVVCVPENTFGLYFPEVEVHAKGGIATIIVDDDLKSYAQVFHQPAVTTVSVGVGKHILAYINSTRNPVTMMTPSLTRLGSPAPLVARFSSRGPSPVTPDIFKPDLTGPGVNILAGWSPISSPSEDPSDTRAFVYNILSGTSMSTPHVAGVAALVKAAYPHWSPAAIKSALMTTAKPLSTKFKQNVDGDLAWGSGHIDPKAALDPGLVYDTAFAEYNTFLCSKNYTKDQIQMITGNRTTALRCPQRKLTTNHLNYPSIAAVNFTKAISLIRTVTNVGAPESVYKVEVHHPSGVHLSIQPDTLKFSNTKNVHSYTVTLSPTSYQPWRENWVFGALVWTDNSHTVTSPVAVGPKLSSPFL